MPLANATLTSDYGEVRNLIIQDGRFYSDVHSGVDYVNGNPNADIIKHDGHYSIYWHLAHGSIKVAVGDTVNPHDYLPD